MEDGMSRRVLLIALLALVPAGVASAAKPASWAAVEIRVLGQDPAAFRPDDTVTRGELAELVAEATATAPPAVAKPDVPLTIQDLDARLVAALGLTPEAKAFATAAKTAGLAPPSRFGTEAVARLLGLRKNHPAKDDALLERLPAEPASRAEAAYSLAQIVRFRGHEVEGLRVAVPTFQLPALTDWQRRILATAFKLVGYPYVWGGTSDARQIYGGKSVPGGFDCSGFVWRVYKLQSYASSGALSATLKGRTTYAMSGEVPKAKRIDAAGLQPADVVFFGAKGPRSKPSEVDHMGIYVGNGWFVHSSRYGVALELLSGWYQERFAWGRRPLAEAGLTPFLPQKR
jgi:cell wall-associated NlpC family hydrolase